MNLYNKGATMKKINYVDYFKVFENKQKKSIVISIGEYHEFYDCADEKSLDVNSIIGNIFAILLSVK